jgi:hypothetical protein
MAAIIASLSDSCFIFFGSDFEERGWPDPWCLSREFAAMKQWAIATNQLAKSSRPHKPWLSANGQFHA